MEMEAIGVILMAFLEDARLYTILALVVVDLVLGVAKALKKGEFEWKKVGDFYTTNIIPYTIGYLAIFGVFYVAADAIGDVLSQGLITTFWMAILASLTGSIASHVKVLIPSE